MSFIGSTFKKSGLSSRLENKIFSTNVCEKAFAARFNGGIGFECKHAHPLLLETVQVLQELEFLGEKEIMSKSRSFGLTNAGGRILCSQLANEFKIMRDIRDVKGGGDGKVRQIAEAPFRWQSHDPLSVKINPHVSAKTWIPYGKSESEHDRLVEAITHLGLGLYADALFTVASCVEELPLVHIGDMSGEAWKAVSDSGKMRIDHVLSGLRV
jgi:hypothetical protein